MLVKNLFFAFALSAIGLAQEIDDNDVPNQCRDVCNSVVSLARTCDQQNDDDRTELNCICQGTNANTQIPICAACVAQFDSDRDDNDVQDLLRSCNLSTTTYNPSATSAAATGAPSSTGGGAQTTGSTGAAQSSGASAASTGGSSPSQTSGGAAQQSTNAAPAPTMGAAGVGLGVLGFALGMM